MRTYVFIIISACFAVSVCAAEPGALETQKREIILAPVTSLTDDEEFLYLRATIRNVLRINLEKQETLELANDRPDAEALIESKVDFDGYLESLASAYPEAIAIVTDFYVSLARLHVLVNVWELETLRIKNSFIETLPADLDMLRNIEIMSSNIAASVARDLPPTPREAIFNKQVISSLRNRINAEEKLTEDIFALRNELSVVLFSGISTGRNILTWSQAGPLVSPVLGIDYSRSIGEDLQVRVGFEYLGLDLLGREADRHEITIEALAGFHTKSPYSFSAEAGISASWEYNEASAALAYSFGLDTFYPGASRFSIGIPLSVGFTLFPSRNFSFTLGFEYNGLAYTFENVSPGDYDAGNKRLKYSYGLSPWNFLCFSISIRTGVRF
jgi:hypothetical protein